jgi:hypothetical protein
MLEKIKKWYNTNNRYKSDSATLFEIIRLMDYSKQNSNKSTEENLYDYLHKNDMIFLKMGIMRCVNSRNTKKELLVSILMMVTSLLTTAYFVFLYH